MKVHEKSPKRSIHGKGHTRGGDILGEEDVEPMPAGWRESLKPPQKCQKCHRAVVVSAGSGEPLCACTRTEK